MKKIREDKTHEDKILQEIEMMAVHTTITIETIIITTETITIGRTMTTTETTEMTTTETTEMTITEIITITTDKITNHRETIHINQTTKVQRSQNQPLSNLLLTDSNVGLKLL